MIAYYVPGRRLSGQHSRSYFFLFLCVLDNTVEKDKVKQAAECCRMILNHVNQALKESEDKQVRSFFIF